MLSFIDCRDFSELTEEEIRAIEEAEHLPPVEACARGHDLANTPKGCRLVIQYMYESIERAEKNQDGEQSEVLHKDLDMFVSEHHYI